MGPSHRVSNFPEILGVGTNTISNRENPVVECGGALKESKQYFMSLSHSSRWFSFPKHAFKVPMPSFKDTIGLGMVRSHL